jgi:hypothetical protein
MQNSFISICMDNHEGAKVNMAGKLAKYKWFPCLQEAGHLAGYVNASSIVSSVCHKTMRIS